MLKMKATILVLLILTVFFRSAFALPPQIEADRQLIKAKEAISEKKFNEALESFEKINALGVEMPVEFTYYFGKVLFETKNYNEAKDQIESYLTIEGRNGTFYQQALALYEEIEQTSIYEEEQKNHAKTLLIKSIEQPFSTRYFLDNCMNNGKRCIWWLKIDREAKFISNCMVEVTRIWREHGTQPEGFESEREQKNIYTISIDKLFQAELLFENVSNYRGLHATHYLKVDGVAENWTFLFNDSETAESIRYSARKLYELSNCSYSE